MDVTLEACRDQRCWKLLGVAPMAGAHRLPMRVNVACETGMPHLPLPNPCIPPLLLNSRESFEPRLVLQQIPQTLPCSAVPRDGRHATLALANEVLPRDALQLRRCCQPELIVCIIDVYATGAPACISQQLLG